MDIRRELQVLRADLIREIDERIGKILDELEDRPSEQPERIMISENAGAFESIYPLYSSPGIFKGKQPTGVIFADGHRRDVRTWKNVYEEILKDCNRDPQKHHALMELRGKAAGRKRVFLSNKKNVLHSPVQIDRALYAETHYDAETLLRILTTRILDVVAYDYSGIQIAVKN